MIAPQDRCVYTLMRLKDGTLRAWIQARGATPTDARGWEAAAASEDVQARVDVACRLAETLKSMHERAVAQVHGDIKTDNVLVEKDRRGGWMVAAPWDLRGGGVA